MSIVPEAQTPLVSETLLKKRRSIDELAYKRSIVSAAQNNPRRKLRGDSTKVKRPEEYLKEYLIKEKSHNRMKRKQRQASRKSSTTIKTPLQKSTVGFVIRINEGKHVSSEIKSQLRELKLNMKYDAQFVKLDEDTIRKFQPLDDYIVYGYITKRSVIELVHRRAFTNAKSQARQPLTDNMTVESLLGDKGILCLNDLSDEIFSVGNNFESAVSILSTFQLSAPYGSYETKILNTRSEVEDKGGFIGIAMDKFLEKIL